MVNVEGAGGGGGSGGGGGGAAGCPSVPGAAATTGLGVGFTGGGGVGAVITVYPLCSKSFLRNSTLSGETFFSTMEQRTPLSSSTTCPSLANLFIVRNLMNEYIQKQS